MRFSVPLRVLFSVLFVSGVLFGQTYVLGPDDQLIVRAGDVEEFKEVPTRIDMRGNINLPLIGRMKAAGLTLEQLEAKIEDRLKDWLTEPAVTVYVHEFRSQPVSILGSVNNPGVLQLQGRRSLFEIISMAGGLRPDAGNKIKITRRKESGPLPLPNTAPDPTGDFSVGEVSVSAVMQARNPAENIVILPNDVISVPKAELVYVVGSVKRSGGCVLGEREKITVLQALSMAEGLDRTASPKSARIIRQVAPNDPNARQEIAVDVRRLLEGRSPDVAMLANDILFVPNSKTKTAAFRGLEAAIQMTVGVVIWSAR